ncbi:FAD-dependent oxidoreductase [Roseovarius spongiae]|uniref:FAD-dependent oxidoreductase n=1 Tax=Roseovarius spongiae TaxID=2320272 RepID=A0A3A8AWU6_9RHOB|nr:NAD(P)/FAD-dependent oxidoreductase [Roseovarius spongiae]RKF14154.1 FAD-dependent oxidoreductase [Roseovarius spongiae]
MTDAASVVIVGAGPAGLAAARRLVAAGIRPVILEETSRPGGQGTRRLAPQMARHRQRMFGADAPAIAARETAEDAVLAQCDFRPDTLVWGCYGSQLELLGPEGYASLPYTHLLLAVGATDRVMPIPGWTLPGVFTLGGAQVALKRHANFAGSQVVFAGSSPLLYLAAAQYLRLGHRRLTVLDTTPLARKIRAFPAMLRQSPGTTFRGVSLMAELRRAKVSMHFGITLRGIEGADRVEALRYAGRNGDEIRLPADAVALGHGLRPETQLAELAGAAFRYDGRHQQWFPRIDAFGRAGEALWIAGDGARTAGAEAADAAGCLAAEGILAALGFPSADALQLRQWRRRLARQQRFQNAMTRAFQWPAGTAHDLPDDTIVCRCERVRAHEIRSALAGPLAPSEINRVKALTRCGMGRCQGRFCGPALAELVADATGERPGRLRAQAPVRPIPLIANPRTER